MTHEALPTRAVEQLAQLVERDQVRGMDARLWNWGAWWRRDNGGEIRRDTGQITRSPIAALIDHAPVTSKTGYSDAYGVPVNEADACEVHGLLAALTPLQRRELHRYYVYSGGSGTPSQQSARRRAVLKLLTLEEVFP